MASFLTPEEIAADEQRKTQLRSTYGRQMARNTFDIGTLGLGTQRSRDRLGYQFDRQRSNIPGGLGARGLLNSGIYKQALEDYATQRTQAFGDLEFSYNAQLGGLNLNAQDYADTMNQGLAGIDAQQAARRAALAAQIRQQA